MTKKLWGGRFEKEVDKDFFGFQKSLSYDYRLAQHDIFHSFIHTKALHKSKLLNDDEYNKLHEALRSISKEIRENGPKFIFECEEATESEDIHTFIQNRVGSKLGEKFEDIALKLHTLRSRNDQIVFDEKCYCVIEAMYAMIQLLKLQVSLLVLIENNKNQYFVGYTHTQRAQAVAFKNYLMTFHDMFERDIEKLKRFEDMPIYIGAGALTGSSLTKKAYEEAIAEVIKEDRLMEKPLAIKLVENGMDNVSDRDFIIEFLSIFSIIQMHLSRFAEDIILYSTKEFNIIELPEEFCTGSSLMPHKKNPDLLELIRGYTGTIYGNLFSVLTTMKGLPLTYNRDMQLDKEPLFSTVEKIKDELKLLTKFVEKIKVRKGAIKDILKKDKTLYATELAEWLVVEHGEAFKRSHDIAGKVVMMLEKNHGNIEELSGKKLKMLHSKLNKKVLKKIMSAEYAISSKKTFTTNPPKIEDVRKQIEEQKA